MLSIIRIEIYMLDEVFVVVVGIAHRWYVYKTIIMKIVY